MKKILMFLMILTLCFTFTSCKYKLVLVEDSDEKEEKVDEKNEDSLDEEKEEDKEEKEEEIIFINEARDYGKISSFDVMTTKTYEDKFNKLYSEDKYNHYNVLKTDYAPFETIYLPDFNEDIDGANDLRNIARKIAEKISANQKTIKNKNYDGMSPVVSDVFGFLYNNYYVFTIMQGNFNYDEETSETESYAYDLKEGKLIVGLKDVLKELKLSNVFEKLHGEKDLEITNAIFYKTDFNEGAFSYTYLDRYGVEKHGSFVITKDGKINISSNSGANSIGVGETFNMPAQRSAVSLYFQ